MGIFLCTFFLYLDRRRSFNVLKSLFKCIYYNHLQFSCFNINVYGYYMYISNQRKFRYNNICNTISDCLSTRVISCYNIFLKFIYWSWNLQWFLIIVYSCNNSSWWHIYIINSYSIFFSIFIIVCKDIYNFSDIKLIGINIYEYCVSFIWCMFSCDYNSAIICSKLKLLYRRLNCSLYTQWFRCIEYLLCWHSNLLCIIV